MIDTNLIEKALNLTGKSTEDMNEIVPDGGGYTYENAFCIEKFLYYLHDMSYIEKYIKLTTSGLSGKTCLSYYACLGTAIAMYIEGDEQPLISLLEKIGNQT